MNPENEIIRAELFDVEEIVRNECWLEAERRGAPVDRHEESIRTRVADIILNGAGAALRRKYEELRNRSSGQSA
jgi:hypothetical protein